MTITDIFRRKESHIDSFSPTFEPFERDEINDRKIIDFASARSELKREPQADAGCSQSIRAFLKISQAERTAAIAESIGTIILILVVLISVLLGIIWGF
jgi:hypothetical protein